MDTAHQPSRSYSLALCSRSPACCFCLPAFCSCSPAFCFCLSALCSCSPALVPPRQRSVLLASALLLFASLLCLTAAFLQMRQSRRWWILQHQMWCQWFVQQRNTATTTPRFEHAVTFVFSCPTVITQIQCSLFYLESKASA
jgi:hypothetical protein